MSRRYKHFDWLYEQLQKKFNFVPIPPLPDKQIQGKLNFELCHTLTDYIFTFHMMQPSQDMSLSLGGKSQSLQTWLRIYQSQRWQQIQFVLPNTHNDSKGIVGTDIDDPCNILASLASVYVASPRL